ncbi:DUF4352 domain-containing protein [Nocardia sp. NPDC057227]|uniref:DUF4352 domain-containing protein n=1 Tax=Nocardia sp. NPDC057227 TaxID=3346056 RepID=UPI00364352D7
MTQPPYPQQPNGPQYPQQQPYGQPYPPPQPPKKKPVWPWVLIGAMVLLCGGCFGIVGLSSNSADEDKSTATFNSAAPGAEPAAVAPETAAPQVASAGATVRDGKFEFRVTGVDAPVKTVGSNPYLKETAQGEFVQVHLVVTNIGDRAQTYFGSNQHLIDTQGRRFDNDTSAEINVNEEIITEINPGNSVNVTVVFDVPAGSVPATLELHDSAFSGGAKVAIG